MGIGAPKERSGRRRFFLEPANSKQRMYEALRAYFIDERPAAEVARAFHYSPGSLQVLCHHFRRDADPNFFVSTRPGPRSQPKKSAARDLIVHRRKQNHPVYEISGVRKERRRPLSPAAVREVLKQEGFAPLPRRLDQERREGPRPTIEAVAGVGQLSLAPRTFTTRCGGLFLFVPGLVRRQLNALVQAAHLPGSKMIPAGHARRACLALKLWPAGRHSQAMALAAGEGLALFSGLPVSPQKSCLPEYSARVSHTQTTQLLAAWHDPVNPMGLLDGASFNLDFHPAPYYGEDPVAERHFVPARRRRQPSILAFLAQDAAGRAFCYSNANLRTGEEAGEIFPFISFWKRTHGEAPRQLVFDSRLTTYANLARLDQLGIACITLRRRSPQLMKEIVLAPRSAWRTVELDVPTRKFKTPRVFEQKVSLAGRTFRQLFIQDLGHDEPAILLTNQLRLPAKKLITRYAQRLLIENALSGAVRFFHMDALSSTAGLKIDFDMILLVPASGIYRIPAKTMRGYSDAQARQIFRDRVGIPAAVTITDREVQVSFHRRSHLPILLSSGLFDKPAAVPWWNGLKLRLTTCNGPQDPKS